MREGRAQRVRYFGQWADEAHEVRQVRRALASIEAAVSRCHDDDTRGPELDAALLAIERHLTRPAAVRTLRRALDLAEPGQRLQAARAALEGIRQNLGAQA